MPEKDLANTIKFFFQFEGHYFKLAIFDEAQRMEKKDIERGLGCADITIFFYDEGQILNAEEIGTKENFIKIAKDLKIDYELISLPVIYRVLGGEKYHNFVENFLDNPKTAYPNIQNYEFKIFKDIEDLLKELRNKATEKNKVALVAAFTESPGDIYNLKSKKNKRIDKNLDIYWLMKDKKEGRSNDPNYPDFWLTDISNNLEYCASVYGCQGLEADYVGVIWGRDFLCRNEIWDLGSASICYDTIGKPKSLKNLMESENKEERNNAFNLLKNRYRIFLTRGRKGTYIFFEDDDTYKLIQP